MIQIIGGNLEQAFEHYNIKAEKKFQAEPDIMDVALQVWELSNEDFAILSEEEDWFDQPFGFKAWWINGGALYAENDVTKGKLNGEVVNLIDTPYKVNRISLNYINVQDYLESHIGISKHNNICYYIHSLAELNNMTKAEFMKRFW